MSNEYDEHWIATYTGLKFHYLNPQPEEICIEDIAHALALTCRFGGHCKTFYSVADHSIHVGELLQYRWRRAGLLHDAHEAYLHDILRPIKADIPVYGQIANRVQEVIDRKFGTYAAATEYRSAIKEADNIMLAMEARDLMANTTRIPAFKGWGAVPSPQSPLQRQISPLTMEDAELAFLFYFREWQ